MCIRDRAYIAEAEKRKARFICLPALAAYVSKLSLCRAVVCVVEITLAVEYLGMRKMYFIAIIGAYVKLYISGDILTEINYALAFRGCEAGNRSDMLMFARCV